MDKRPEDLHNSLLNRLRSLLDLCALHIVGNASLMAIARTALPTKLHNTLLKAALLLSNDAAIEQLISTWPWKDLSLCNFTQPILCSLNPVFSEVGLREQMKRSENHAACLTRIFMKCLWLRGSTKLRCLDLTGRPCAEEIVSYIASNMLLEDKQRQIIQQYNSIAQNLALEQKQQDPLEYTFPNEKFVFSIDALLKTEDAHMELWRALSVSQLPESCLKLRINKLEMLFRGAVRIAVLLELLDPEFLTDLSIRHSYDIIAQGLAHIAPQLELFAYLSGLDLSSNGIDATMHNEKAAVILSDIVANLPSLQRLNLSNNNLKGTLSKILSNAVQPLTMLRVRRCGLADPDLACLLHSKHRLEELDLSENPLSDCFPMVLSLVRALSPSVLTLELEDVGLQCDQFRLLFKTCVQLSKLCLLNVARNRQLMRSTIINSIAYFTWTPRLQVIKLSYPTDVEVGDGRKEKFSRLIDDMAGQFCDLLKRCTLRFVFL